MSEQALPLPTPAVLASPAPEGLDARLTAAGPALLAYFRRRVEQPEDAQDLLGEVMVIAFRRAASVPDDPDETRMWLYAVAQNVLATHRRAKARAQRLDGRLRDEAIVSRPSSGPDDADSSGRVREALAMLKRQDQDLITLIHWEGMTIADAARVLGVRDTTARSRYHRARAALRHHLETDGHPLIDG